ncbi:MAG: RDD family protein [Planctomycetes bacterium]|nr:RDD family protein [Planctomycetota bacterium]
MSEAFRHDSWECPICLKPRRRPPDHKRLYNELVCKRCRNGFANRRQAAWIVDYVVIYFLLGAGLLLVLEFLRANAAFSSDDVFSDAVDQVVGFAVLPFVFAMKDGFNGRSPGKLLFGLQVVDAHSREPISWGQSLKRNLIVVVPVVALIGIIGGLLTMLRGRRWGEEWAGTEVVWLKHATRQPFAPAGRYCRVCGYDLTGNLSGRCPECGTEIRSPELVPPAA